MRIEIPTETNKVGDEYLETHHELMDFDCGESYLIITRDDKIKERIFIPVEVLKLFK